MKTLGIRSLDVTQYLSPLRQGSGMPAIVTANDDAQYVMKFRGAGQGTRALIAELLGAEVARTIGLNVPELVFLHLDDNAFGTAGPDDEIQDLIDFSVGLNLGLEYLADATGYDPITDDEVDSMTASKVVMLDSIISNIDRTARNNNLLKWNKELWLIDHGASFYFHHDWPTWTDHLKRTFPLVRNHVLLQQAKHLHSAVEEIKSSLTIEKIGAIVRSLPSEWLEDESEDTINHHQMREAYCAFVSSRITKLDELVQEAEDARLV